VSFASSDQHGYYLLLGMRDMAKKSASDTLDCFKDILNDISNDSENENAGKEILTHIKTQ